MSHSPDVSACRSLGNNARFGIHQSTLSLQGLDDNCIGVGEGKDTEDLGEDCNAEAASAVEEDENTEVVIGDDKDRGVKSAVGEDEGIEDMVLGVDKDRFLDEVAVDEHNLGGGFKVVVSSEDNLDDCGGLYFRKDEIERGCGTTGGVCMRSAFNEDDDMGAGFIFIGGLQRLGGGGCCK